MTYNLKWKEYYRLEIMVLVVGVQALTTLLGTIPN